MLVLVTTEITKNTWTTPLERWHGILQNTCRAQDHSMHTLIMAKNDKSAFVDKNLKLTAYSPLPTAFRTSG